MESGKHTESERSLNSESHCRMWPFTAFLVIKVRPELLRGEKQIWGQALDWDKIKHPIQFQLTSTSHCQGEGWRCVPFPANRGHLGFFPCSDFKQQREVLRAASREPAAGGQRAAHCWLEMGSSSLPIPGSSPPPDGLAVVTR